MFNALQGLVASKTGRKRKKKKKETIFFFETKTSSPDHINLNIFILRYSDEATASRFKNKTKQTKNQSPNVYIFAYLPMSKL